MEQRESAVEGAGRRSLAGLDQLPDAEELRAEARQLLPVGGGAVGPPPRQEATDPTGRVRVTVDERARLQDVQISPRWRDHLDADELADAVMTAYRTAAGHAIDAFALAHLAAADAGGGTDRDQPTRTEVAPTDPAGWSEWTARTIDRARDVREQMSRAGAARPRERTGPHGCFTATMRGDEPVGLAGDARRIRHADTGQLHADLREVLTGGHG